MAVTADSVVVELEARTAGYTAAIKKAETDFTRSMGGISQSSAKTTRDIKRFETQVKQSSGEISAGIKSIATAFAATFTASQVQGLIDGYTRVQNALKVSGLEGQNLANVQGRLLDLSTRYGVALESLANLYGNASQTAKDLGANEAQLVQITEATAQALKITGTSAAAASGAILGLQQALASGTVRAEEFNQINEGGLRPLLQLAANADKFGGSVAKLRLAVVEGKVSSQEFFAAILNGAGELEAKASRATLTLSGAFEALTSKLTVYVGQAAQTSGVTNALSNGILALANNLDTAANILAVIATVGIGRLTAGLVASLAATSAQSAATVRATLYQRAYTAALAENAGMLNAQAVAAARATAAVTATGVAARVAGASLLAAFGGPVGLAITALALGMGVAASSSDGLSDSVEDLESQLDEARATADGFAEAARKAGGRVDDLSKASNSAEVEVGKLTRAYREGAKAAEELANKTGLAALRTAQLNIQQAQEKKRELSENSAQRRAVNASGLFGRFLPSGSLATTMPTDSERQKSDLLDQQIAAYRAQIRAITANPNFGTADFNPGGTTGGTTADPKRKTRGRSGSSGPSAEQIAADQAREISRLQQEELRARIELTSDVAERGALERDLLRLEYTDRLQDIADNKDLDEAQKAERVKILESLYGQLSAETEGSEIVVQNNNSLYARQQWNAQLAATAEEEARTASARAELAIAELELQSAMTDDIKQKRDIELQILDIKYQELVNAQQRIIDDKTLSDAVRERARLEKARLEAEKGARVADANERGMSQYERYRTNLDSAQSLADEIDRIKIDTLEAITDELTNATKAALGLKGAFGNIVAELIRIGIQRKLIGPIADFLFGGSGGGGGGGLLGDIFSAVGSLFAGRASGGNVMAGKPYMVGEKGKELFVPAQSGKIFPTGALGAAASRGGGAGTVVQQTFVLDARGGVVTQDLLRQVNALATQKAATAGRAAYENSPSRLAKRETLGT